MIGIGIGTALGFLLKHEVRRARIGLHLALAHVAGVVLEGLARIDGTIGWAEPAMRVALDNTITQLRAEQRGE